MDSLIVPGAGSAPDFRNAPTTIMYRRPEGRATRPFLVFVRAGSAPVPQPHWAVDASDRPYDIMANFFAPPSPDCWLLERADYVCSGGLSKFHAAKLLLQQELVHRYSGVLFLDDDVETHFDPGVFAGFVMQQGFALAQAALTSDSFASWAITLVHPSCAWRITNFIEVMAPFFTGELLRDAIGEFDASISSWGLDVLWGARYAERGFAVIDFFTMRHRRPVDSKNGAYYQYLRSIGVEPNDELGRIFQRLKLQRYEIATKRVVFQGCALPAPLMNDSAPSS